MFVRRIFDRYAGKYDQWYSKHPRVFESEVAAIKALGLEGFGLELGVGSGVFAAALKVDLGVDPSLGMLRIAKRRKVTVVQALGEKLPFRDGSFDYALLANTLCFLEKPDATLKEVWRVLKSDRGIILCEVPRGSSWRRFVKEEGKAGHRFYSHAKLYTVMEMQHILKDAGFRVVDMKGTLSFNPSDEEMVEEPVNDIEGKGFVCLRGVKS